LPIKEDHMARETKLGMVLMVLLVGVFGFMVYKKWNSRQPTAMVAAAEAAPESGQEAEQEPEPAPPAESPEPTAAASNHGLAAMPTDANPFAKPAATTLPPQPAEPATTFAGEPFVRNSAETEPPAQVESPAEIDAEAFPQSQPVAADTELVFAESSAAPAQAEPTADFATTQPATTARPDASAIPHTDPPADPFATATTATIAASPAAEQELETTVSATTASGEPFAEAAEIASPLTAESAAASPFGDVASSDDAFSDAATSAPASTAADSPGLAEPGPGPTEPTVAEAETDPFSGAQADSASPAQPDVEPARLFADDASGLSQPEPFAPPSASEASMEDIPLTAATSQATASQVVPGAQSPRQNYVVVGENDSYWALSKRVYGTPAYFHALEKYNSSRIKDSNRLKAGMKVLTPEPHELQSLFPHLISEAGLGKPAQEANSGISRDAQGAPIYRVGASDTLSGIAQAHLGRASRWVQIYEMNRNVVSDPKALKPGTVLRLPADASRVRLVPQG
jgi:LysM repeat protein